MEDSNSNINLCPLTGLTAIVGIFNDFKSYTITIFGREITNFICTKCTFDFKAENHNIIKGLIANGLWPNRTFIKLSTCNKTPARRHVP
jgi:hypothetical protein